MVTPVAMVTVHTVFARTEPEETVRIRVAAAVFEPVADGLNTAEPQSLVVGDASKAMVSPGRSRVITSLLFSIEVSRKAYEIDVAVLE